LAALGLVLEQSKDSWLLYLGRLFSGAACERLDRFEEAEAHYRHATELRPDAQSAMVALSYVQQRLGRIREATEALLPLATPAAQIADDPWWEYYFGQWRHVSPALAKMRKAVQR
jgi:Flp pilus assembly protein TadD